MISKSLSRIAVLFVLFSFTISTIGQIPPPFPVKRSETPDDWRRDGWSMIDSAKKVEYKYRKAKNVILFIGDGMGVSTLTAARILEGQLRGESGEENRLSFEQFPFSALSKTYSVTQQTSDSAPTMSAIITGVKANAGMISVNSNVRPDDYRTVKGNEAKTLVEYAEESGRSTGIISTARLTHATPAACYAHSPKRGWEDDTDMLRRDKDAVDGGFLDIARQFVEFKYGDGPEVAFGGGRSKFMPSTAADPEYPDKKGDRSDGRDLIAEWQAKYPGSQYVWDKKGFDAIDAKKTKHVLGMFEPSHMRYEKDRANDKAGEPSLTEMTTKAIDILSNNKKGYFLMVEGGRIDHAHHDGNAYHALTETIELSNAVRAAASKVDLSETLIVVTADHSHTFVISGYPYRGNNILGLVREEKSDGTPADKYKTAKDGKPYTTLGYTNGLGAVVNGERATVTQEEALDPDFLQPALVPMGGETHGGEDVAIFATGVNAFLFRGSMEENWTFYVIADAMRFGRK
jgi:alkaline phosphatase